MQYKPTIGLEIHAELKTLTKMFCNSPNRPDCNEVNANICPVCMGHPGTLPTINKQAVKSVLMVGLALGGKLADYSEFDRKNYFYPDLPKGYQISQYEFPLVSGGALAGVDITRVHLEEDTARSQHSAVASAMVDKSAVAYDSGSLLDFNRAGVPLMELVTEPVIHTDEQASIFAKELQLLLRTLGVSEANMEKGEMRVEANISIAPVENKEGGQLRLGTKVEVKNLNSTRAVRQCIAFEIERQSSVLNSGKSVVQETRGWDENKQCTFSQRIKEDSHDYRYLPEPDLPKLVISLIPEFSKENLQSETPELPQAKRERYKSHIGISDDTLEILVNNLELGGFFDRVVDIAGDDKDTAVKSANYIAADVAGLIGQSNDASDALSRISPKGFVELMRMSIRGDLSSRGVKDILKVMSERGGDPSVLAKEMDLTQMSDDRDLKKIARQVIEQQSKAALDYKAGKEASLQFLVGQAMKASRGAANPEAIRPIFIELLK